MHPPADLNSLSHFKQRINPFAIGDHFYQTKKLIWQLQIIHRFFLIWLSSKFVTILTSHFKQRSILSTSGTNSIKQRSRFVNYTYFIDFSHLIELKIGNHAHFPHQQFLSRSTSEGNTRSAQQPKKLDFAKAPKQKKKTDRQLVPGFGWPLSERNPQELREASEWRCGCGDEDTRGANPSPYITNARLGLSAIEETLLGSKKRTLNSTLTSQVKFLPQISAISPMQ